MKLVRPNSCGKSKRIYDSSFGLKSSWGALYHPAESNLVLISKSTRVLIWGGLGLNESGYLEVGHEPLSDQVSTSVVLEYNQHQTYPSFKGKRVLYVVS